MQDIKLDTLSTVTGGTKVSALRDAVKLIKSAHPNPFDLGGAAYDVKHTSSGFAALTKPRSWLGGLSFNGKVQELMGAVH